MSDEAPKSAVELAMERLRRRDAAAGAVERPLSDAQKAEIADLRQVYAAKLAQEDILHQSRLATTWDPADRQQAEDQHRREVARLTGDRDAKIAAVRAKSDG